MLDVETFVYKSVITGLYDLPNSSRYNSVQFALNMSAVLSRHLSSDSGWLSFDDTPDV